MCLCADWQVLEDVALAAATCGEHTTADACLQRLRTQFPDSTRVQCLHGTCLEARREFADAAEVYGAVLEKQPANMSAHRRQVQWLSCLVFCTVL